MLRDPGLKFRIFLIFRLILYQVLGKVTKFGENWLKNKKVTGKKQIGGGSPPPPPVLIGLMYQNEILQKTCDYQVLLEDHQLFFITSKVGSKFHKNHIFTDISYTIFPLLNAALQQTPHLRREK